MIPRDDQQVDRPAEGVAVIVGAGPAGLTAAYELLQRGHMTPVVIEASERMGGISTTVDFKGNRLDVGPHRFFSKSDRVTSWWLEMIPLRPSGDGNAVADASLGAVPATEEPGMLLLRRRTRIRYAGKMFDYPLRLTASTLSKLGLKQTARFALSYARSALSPITPEQSLEHFFINRFGRELYRTFFQSYTEKVWGVPCKDISAEWGEQRVKGLSVAEAVRHSLRRILFGHAGPRQEGTETSLVEQFLYPEYGAGQMWEEVARRVRQNGGTILTGLTVDRLRIRGNRVVAVEAVGAGGGARQTFEGDFFFSTMPIGDLVCALGPDVPQHVAAIARGLVHRSTVVVGLLLRNLTIDGRSELGRLGDDNWVYIQGLDVKVGRLQVYNNWGTHMVADPAKVWLGMEYFCSEGDELWRMADQDIVDLATAELCAMNMARRTDVLDSTVLRMPKTYPAYWGTYARFDELRAYLDRFENLCLLGRNGMHKYNNQDHSMLTAMVAVDNIVAGRHDRANVWDVNTEQEHHEGS